MQPSTALVWILLLMLPLAAQAVQRQVLVSGAEIGDLPRDSISFGGSNVSNVEAETEERDDGVLITLTYDDGDDDVGGTLGLPADVGAVTEFRLPNNTAPVAVNVDNGLITPYRPMATGRIPSGGRPEQGISLTVGGGWIDAVTSNISTSGVQVSPEEGTPSLESDDELDVTGVSAALSFPIGDRFTLSVGYLDWDGDESSAAEFEPGLGIDWGVLYPFDDGGETGLVAGDSGIFSASSLDVEGSKYALRASWPCDREFGRWNARPFLGVSYADEERRYDQRDSFPAIPDVTVRQRIDVDVEMWSLYAGLDVVRPINDFLSLRISGALTYQDLEVDADIVQSTDLFGDVTDRALDVSDSESNVGFIGGVGFVMNLHPNVSLDVGYSYLGNGGYADVSNTTNGDAILDGETFDVDVETGDSHGFTASFIYRFGG